MQYIYNILIGLVAGVISQTLSSTDFVLMILSYLIMIIIASTSGKDFIIQSAIVTFIGIFIGYNLKGSILRGSDFNENYMLWGKIALQSASLILGTYLVKSAVSKKNNMIGIVFIIISILIFCIQAGIPNMLLR